MTGGSVTSPQGCYSRRPVEVGGVCWGGFQNAVTAPGTDWEPATQEGQSLGLLSGYTQHNCLVF